MITGILEGSAFSGNVLKSLKNLGKVKVFDGKNRKAFLKDIEILFVRLNHSIDKGLIDQAPGLRVICSPTTGLNHIDTTYCSEKNIKIISLKGESGFLKTIRATPEHTLGLIIALKRNYHQAFLNMDNREWNREKFRGYEIFNSDIGIIGLGRVGSILSDYLIKMGANVGYYDIKKRKSNSRLKRFKSINALIESCDTIVLCSSYNEITGCILEKREINLLKDKYFVNTARAELTDEKYLVDMAAQSHFKGIAIDVIQEEQTSRKFLDKWLNATAENNIIITPHIGGATYTSMIRTEEFILKKLMRTIEQA